MIVIALPGSNATDAGIAAYIMALNERIAVLPWKSLDERYQIGGNDAQSET